jgi:hypothetical protein
MKNVFVMKRTLIVFTSMAVAVLLCDLVYSAPLEDDLASLKQQVASLKEENKLLRTENIQLRKEIQQLKSSNSGATSKPDRGKEESTDEIVGAIWEITAQDKTGKRYGPFKFLAQEGAIYGWNDVERRKLGTYTEKGAEVRVDVTNHENKAANGVYRMVRFSRKPLTYKGQFVNTQGHSLTVDLRIIVD